ncbi:MAG: hypothetical protein HOA15_07495 [Candidatus Marinimicrobia bacterium]|jgi:hypothetical protein|nr:hypothetical protein [Candidatus Neomarinimicrobiota bacterium]MBT3763403.1 hypothetical protein [Candidatus Neomarinimicrobiota bacterium]MBT4271177.1 hypothetical protein [Candidatus Neomarinimicrobiota bacterium]MBT4809574.1 hypothetical protein [Candidatus Neomarinimicrobiota bacterium]MBT5176080.1 hypothetical protein [Candidatus Neomarinimicrobiota bacterium]
MKKINTFITIISLGILFGQGPSNTLFQQDKGESKKGKWVRDHYQYKVGNVDELKVNIDFGIGELTLDANMKPMVINGDIFYYPSKVDPEIDYTERIGRGIFSIKTDHDKKYDFDFDDNTKLRGPLSEFENKLEFSIPKNIPIEFDMDFGIGEANIDFTGLTLSRVIIDCGLGSMNVSMNTPNLETCDFLRIDTGLGEFNAEGLGNLNAREVDIEVGLGSADIDFRGEITKNIEIDIKVGMGSLDLVLPENVNVKAKVHHNFLSSVDLDDFIKKGNQYLTEDWNSDWPTVYLDISVGLGSIDVNRR